MHRLAVVLAITAACASGAPDPLPASRSSPASSFVLGEDARSDLFAADAAHTASIAQLGPVDGVLRALRGNAVYLAPGIDIVRGVHDIRQVLVNENLDASDVSVARTLAGGDVSSDGNFGFTFGWLTRVANGITTYGTYFAIWERADGEEFRVTAYYTRSGPFPHIPARAGFPLFLDGAGAGGVAHPGDVPEQRRSVMETDEEFAALSVERGTGVAFPTYASPDFLMVFGRNFVGLVGEEEIASAYAASVPNETLDWTPIYAGAAGSGDLAYTVGTAVDTMIDSLGVPHTTYSKYLTLWARSSDGSWRFIADGAASSPDPAPSSSPAPQP